MDIYCVYLDTHSSHNRQQSIRLISNSLLPKSQVVSIIAGDFNFVENTEDRWNISAQQYSGTNNSNALDAEVFKDLIRTPFEFCEWEQPYYTCDAGGARSKVDRMYINQHITFQLDHQCSTSVLEWDFDLSRHRPIVFQRRSHVTSPGETRPLQSHVFNRPGWANDVIEVFKAKCIQDHIAPSACRRLVLLKDAIREASTTDHNRDNNVHLQENQHDDGLGHTMACLKCLAEGSISRAERCISRDPTLRSLVRSPILPHNIGYVVHKLREHAAELAREAIHRDTNLLANFPPDDPEEKQRFKEHILKKIKRLSPGENSSINAMMNKHNQVVTSPDEIAALLREHWQGVFQEKQVDACALQIWMEELFVKDEQGLYLTGLPEKTSGRWNVRRKMVSQAIRSAKASMPGPDGIPAKAYQMLGSIAVDLLHGAIQSLSSDQGQVELIAAYGDRSPPNTHDFNLSLLCCLPKKAAGHDPTAGEYFSGENTRPLALVNVDNRIMASAARLTWEPLLNKYVSLQQQGFIKGRQMLGNVIDIDFHSMRVSLTKESGAVIFFDFKAAFPSVSHAFLRQSLSGIGLPEHALAFIDALYSHNNCNIAYKGNTYKGFGMHCGVRQGCPLSPLLFAAAVDILLRRLDQMIRNGVIRAFADDIGMVVEDFFRDGRIAQTVFTEFATMSGLELNLPKTVAIPLWPKGTSDIQRMIAQGDFFWDHIHISNTGKYLGFSSGPGKGTSSWDAPTLKYLGRTRRWQEIGAGTQFATLAYNTFAFSTLGFVSQLESPPPSTLSAEQQGLRNMLPGPGNWFCSEDAFFFKEGYGQARSFHSLGIVSSSAKLRIVHMHNTARSEGLIPCSQSIFAMSSQLKGYLDDAIELDRVVEWSAWYAGAHVHKLAENVSFLQSRNITLSGCLQDIAGGPPPWVSSQKRKQRKELQKHVTYLLRSVNVPDYVERVRHKITRWVDPEANKPSDHESARMLLYGPAAHIARRVHLTLQRLHSLVPPRVASAMIHTLWNGWCTARRFQDQSPANDRCWLGCGETAHDSIEHYCRCPVGRGVLASRLRIVVSPRQALPVWLLAHKALQEDEVLAMTSLFVYAMYKSSNHYRHTRIVNPERSADSVRQHIIQGCQGNETLAKWVDGRWRRPMLHIA